MYVIEGYSLFNQTFDIAVINNSVKLSFIFLSIYFS